MFLTAVVTYSHSAEPPFGFVLVNGGSFMIGSPANEIGRSSNEMQRQITLNSFYMGKNEVTQAEYQELTGVNPSFFKGENLPVEQVTWFEAVIYCNLRSEKEGLETVYIINGNNVTWNKNAKGYRLPTEAEWEYACRAGTTTPFSTGINITSDQANYNGNQPYGNNTRGINRATPIPVGSFEPNIFGLYDMHGNVGEWCWDWLAEYAKGPQSDPSNEKPSGYRIFRGGGWNHSGVFIRSAKRGALPPSNKGYYLGFRLVRNI